MLTEETPLDLETIAGGAAIERFNDAMLEVLDNIMDPNTGIMSRAVTLRVNFKPDETREFIQITIECGTKLAPAQTIGTNAYLGRDISGRAIAHEIKKAQLPLIPDNVIKMKGQQKNA
jgi:hypothetical protein